MPPTPRRKRSAKRTAGPSESDHELAETRDHPMKYMQHFSKEVKEKDAIFLPKKTTLLSTVEASCKALEIEEQYKLVAHICYSGDWPCSYGFAEVSMPRPSIASFSMIVGVDDWTPTTTFPDWYDVWLLMNPEAQDKLYVLLWSVIEMSRTTYRNEDVNLRWIPVCSSSPKIPDAYNCLQCYGPNKQNYDLRRLTRERNISEMKALTENSAYEQFGDEMVVAWSSALVAGMTNGVGRIAVYKLMQCIIKLFHCFDFPSMHVLNTTASKGGGFEISDNISVTSGSLSDSASETEFSSPEGKGFKHLAVVSQEASSGSTRYILLIEVQSWGKSETVAKKKLMKDIITALQSQSTVFGLLISSLKGIIYHAVKNSDGKVTLSAKNYTFPQRCALESDVFTMNVAVFQMLIMDIFTSLYFGMQTIIWKT